MSLSFSLPDYTGCGRRIDEGRHLAQRILLRQMQGRNSIRADLSHDERGKGRNDRIHSSGGLGLQTIDFVPG